MEAVEYPFNPILKTPDFELNSIHGTLKVPGHKDEIYLTRKETHIFAMLVRNRFTTLDRKDILKNVWQGVKVNLRTVDANVCNLRMKLPQQIADKIFTVRDGYSYN